MERVYTVAIRSIAVAGVVFATSLAATRPLTVAEAALWDHLIRPPIQEALHAPDAWTGLLYSILAERSIGLLRLSEFSLRLPSVLAATVIAVMLWRNKSRFIGAVYILALAAGWFSTAQGGGIGLAFWAASLYWRSHAGWLLGLAIASSPLVAPLAFVYWRITEIERVVIPAVVTAFILLLFPASHAGSPDPSDARPKFEREANRRNAARGGAFEPPEPSIK